MSERIQKVLARAGVGSRRAIERWITEGGVRVNGEAAHLGAAVSAGDRVEVRGRRYWVIVERSDGPRWLRYNKPAGRVTTRNDPEGRRTVFEQLPNVAEGRGRWVSLGRLDIATTGLMLFTDDGSAAHALTHPSAGIEREYAVRVRGPISDEGLQRLSNGVLLEDGEARFERISDAGGEGSNHWYHVVVREGRQNEVRRLWEAVGCQVARLTRVRFGPIALPRRLRRGRFEDLTRPEVDALNRLAGVESGERSLGLEPFKSRSGKKKTRARAGTNKRAKTANKRPRGGGSARSASKGSGR